MSTPKITGKKLLMELDFPAYMHVDFIKCSYGIFSESINNLLSYYVEKASGSTKGEASFAIRFLFARCINDLISGYHLATHGYTIQCYSVQRGILESLDLIALFIKDNSYSATWINNPKQFRTDYKLWKIRQILGKSTYDDLYGHFCEMGSHPSFQSSRTMSYMRKQPNKNPQIIVRVGPTDLVYPIIFSLGFSYLLLLSIVLLMTRYFETNHQGGVDFFMKELNYYKICFKDCLQPALAKSSGKQRTDIEDILNEISKLEKTINKTNS